MNGGDMSAPIKDPAIKLFGAKIRVPDTQVPDISKEKTKAEAEYTCADNSEGPHKSSSLSNAKEEYQTPVQANEMQDNAMTKADLSESIIDQEKVFKRPDKIIPCPRCRSMDTKFCYFNNYNFNQPRHFCKNCQRYWTAGGTMRNVPVGAGRRKNKHFASQYHQIIVSPDELPVTGLETPNSPNHQLMPCGDCATTFRPSTGSGTVLKFGPEVTLCESMETVLNLGDQKRSVEMGSVTCVVKGEEPSTSGSSMKASSIQGNELPENVMQNERVMMTGSCNELDTLQPTHCCSVPPWVIPWNPGWNNVASMAVSQYPSDLVCVPNSNNPGPVQWCPTTVLSTPGFSLHNIPLQLVPASYWGVAVWADGAGNIPFAGPNGCLSPSSSTSNNSCCSGNGSLTLGKHSRDPHLIEGELSEKCVLVPKTLRIDDPDEASRSPIWASLSIKPDRKDFKLGSSIFKGFETNKEDKANMLDGTEILEANPAALSRSHTFQEST